MSLPEISIAGRKIGPAHPPLVVAEIGINHEGRLDVAKEMVDAAISPKLSGWYHNHCYFEWTNKCRKSPNYDC